MTPTTRGIRFEQYNEGWDKKYVSDPRNATLYNFDSEKPFQPYFMPMEEAIVYFIMNS